ncbi:hypothetical protein [Thauera humireducens]|uniref:general secretion pathway protein GspK n=1 Tax=Thauera humireducens TaxID=1134435 RepID=UPI00311EA369
MRGMRVRHRGLALVAVLWMIAALTLLVASLVAVSRAGTQSAQNHTAVVRATAVGDAAIQLALVEAQHQQRSGERRLVGEYVFDGARVQVELLPASAYINLNRASPALLQALLVVAGGLDAASAEILAGRIVDWRDVDDAAFMPGGSELDPYLAGGWPFVRVTAPSSVTRICCKLPASDWISLLESSP